MPPKTKVSKEEILSTAVNLVRNDGENALNARNIARSLGCSTQPIFSNFINMDELRAAVKEKANILYQNCLATDMSAGKYPPYKASGMAYIRFAREEKAVQPFPHSAVVVLNPTVDHNVPLGGGAGFINFAVLTAAFFGFNLKFGFCKAVHVVQPQRPAVADDDTFPAALAGQQEISHKITPLTWQADRGLQSGSAARFRRATALAGWLC